MKKWSLLLVFCAVILVAAGCNSPSAEEATSTPAEEGDRATEESPLVYNLEEGTLSVFAEVNGKYLHEPTRHGMNFHEGNYGDEAIFTAYANPLDFHDALLELNAEPGNNLGEDSEDVYIEGSTLDITFEWEGADRVYDINDVIIDSTGKEIEQKFGGNYENAHDMFTGCLMCLDSCPVGVTSNASQPVDTFENHEAEFFGNPDVLPEDGTPVVVTFHVN